MAHRVPEDHLATERQTLPLCLSGHAEERKAIDEPTRQLWFISHIDGVEIDWEEYTGPVWLSKTQVSFLRTIRTVDHVLAEALGEEYRPLRSLAEAQQVPDGRVIMEGDWGGQVYLTFPASMVRCSQEALHRLLLDIDARCWGCNRGEGAGVYFERKPVGA